MKRCRARGKTWVATLALKDSVRAADFIDHTVYDLAINSGADIRSFPNHYGKSLHQFLLCIGLQEVTARARAEGVADQFRGFVQREQNDFHSRLRLSNRASRFDAVQPRHGQIHDDDFRLQFCSQANGIIPIVGLAAELPLREWIQYSLNAATNEGVVIDDKYSRHGPGSPLHRDGGQGLGLAKRRRQLDQTSISNRLLMHTQEHSRRARGASCFDDLILYSVAYDLADGVHFQLSHDIGAMSFCRLDAYPERDGHFLATFSFREQLHNFALAGGKPIPQMSIGVRHRILVGETVQEHLRSAGGEKRSMIGERFDRSNKIAICIGLHDVGAGASLDDVANKLVGKMEREN